ncbi:hypothetical protein [Nonomuraea africana]|uniref:Uncharacterized protein n=1 Tax=Nonomuraea africana TaxID=46171 RepID=A0ABR9KK85_9ACTN|nr:hypothetical protein [Nonomuraea africana]MBE1561957.1 hypothetical protein [Nonomuraea africana]
MAPREAGLLVAGSRVRLGQLGERRAPQPGSHDWREACCQEARRTAVATATCRLRDILDQVGDKWSPSVTARSGG